MARISLISPESASPEVREIYETTLRGKPGNMQKALAHRPEMLKNFLASTPAWDALSTASCTNSSTSASRSSTDAAIARSTTWLHRSALGSLPKTGQRSRQETIRTYSEKERAALTYVEKADSRPARNHAMTDFDELKKHFSDAGDCRSAHARRPREPHQPRHRPARTGTGISGRKI